MTAFAQRKTKALVALAALMTAAALAAPSAVGQLDAPGVSTPTTTIDLCAKAGTLELPGAVSVPVWGFATLSTGQTCADVTASVPGPVLDVAQGEIVRVVLHNDLAEPVGLEIPGRTVEEGAVEAPAGGTAEYTFTASDPGTYLYQSPSNAGRQLAMGLYGGLVVRSATPNQAYGTAESEYDVEATLVLSAIDPALNANPDTFNMLYWAPTYWLINGKAYPDTDPISAPAGSRVLLRYLNAGFDNTSMALLGAHEQVIARDAYLLSDPFGAVAETLPAGETTDAIVTAPAAGSSYPLYNRQLHLTNGTVDPSDAYPYSSPGGMMTFIQGS